MEPAQRDAIAAPTWEHAVREKAREIVTTLERLEVQASPVSFKIDGVGVELAWGPTDADVQITVADGAYVLLRIPVAWLTAGRARVPRKPVATAPDRAR